MRTATNLLFDLDGTITDSAEGIINCLAYALDQVGCPATSKDDLRRYVGPPLFDTLTSLVGADKMRTAYDHYIDRFDKQNKGIEENAVYDDVPLMLDKLHQAGKHLYIATSKPELTAEKILKAFGLASAFDAIHGALWDGVRREKSAVIAYVCDIYRLDPADTIMIGDRHHDIEGATQNGLRSIGVLWGYGGRDELLKAGADALAEKPADLISLLV